MVAWFDSAMGDDRKRNADRLQATLRARKKRPPSIAGRRRSPARHPPNDLAPLIECRDLRKGRNLFSSDGGLREDRATNNEPRIPIFPQHDAGTVAHNAHWRGTDVYGFAPLFLVGCAQRFTTLCFAGCQGQAEALIQRDIRCVTRRLRVKTAV